MYYKAYKAQYTFPACVHNQGMINNILRFRKKGSILNEFCRKVT